MKEIPLTRGLVTVVDDDVFDDLNQFKWSAVPKIRNFYARRENSLGSVIYMHRVIIGADKGVQVDHIDRDGLNNLRSNLRFCNKQQNGFNSQLGINNTSGFKGAAFHRLTGKWRSRITVSGRDIHLGLFATAEEAAHAYDDAAHAYAGEFACLNFPLAVSS